MKVVCLKSHLVQPMKEAFPQLEICDEIHEDAQILVADSPQCTEELLSQLPQLKFIQATRAGYEEADLDYMRKQDIRFCNAKGLFSVPVAEDIVSKVLIYSLNTLQYVQQQKDKEFKTIRERNCLNRMCIGFLGTGSLALEAAKRLKGFDSRIIGYKRSYIESLPNFDALYYGDQLSEFLSQCDILVLTVDLNEHTYHMINAETLAMMKPQSAIINVARGAVIDDQALIDCLNSGHIRFAGLDVFDPEPLPVDSPYWDMKQVYITPHASWTSKDNRDNLFKMVRDNVQNYLEGKALFNQVL